MTKATIIAEGWIQSVGYRAFVKRVASQLGLKGLVRNLPDGKVEIFCEGNLPKINELLQKLDYKGKKGDALSAYVENLSLYREGEKGYLGSWKEYSGFEINYGFNVASPVDQALIEYLESGTLYVVSLKDEFSQFRKETNENFEAMDAKYGSISDEMKKMNENFSKLVNAYINKQK
jgi:acylphosphatase